MSTPTETENYQPFPQIGPSRVKEPDREFKRAYMACIPCRRNKAKCEVTSFAEPCTKCKRERRECVFSRQRSAKKRRRVDQDKESVEKESIEILAPSQHNIANDPEISSSNTINPGNGGITGLGNESNPYILERHLVEGVDDINGEKSDARQRASAVDTEMMHTVVASSNDALGLLFRAAEQQDMSESEDQPSPAAITKIYESPGSALTSSHMPMPVIPSRLSSASNEVLDVWGQFRFVRQGWLTAREAVTYTDLFFQHLAPHSPIVSPEFADHKNHMKLITQEPFLCCTILTISSRHHVMPGIGGASRAQFIHMRLWKHCEHLIQRLTFGQEKYSIAKSRTLGSIQALLLLTEWHPRVLHFPPENDGWDASLAPSFDDAYGRKSRNDDNHFVKWREEVFEPAKRSNRMSWMLLGLATSLAHELSVFDIPDLEEQSTNSETFTSNMSKLRLQRLLFIFVNQLASRIGCTSLLPLNACQDLTDDDSACVGLDQEGRERQRFMGHWIEITKLLRTSTEMFFPNKSVTRSLLKSGRYLGLLEHFNPLLRQWHNGYCELQGCETLSKESMIGLYIDYQYVRMYINSLAIQALVERVSSRGNSDLNVLYDVATIERSKDYKYVVEVTDASRQILESAVTLAEASTLRFAPVRTYLRVTSASIFLLKSISLGARTQEVNRSLNALDRCIQALRSDTLDDIHLSSRYGALIERHVARFRRNFRGYKTGLSVPQTPFVPQEHLLGRPEASFNSVGVDHMDSGTLSIDEWLTQPFDPSFAPFGLGDSYTVGLEVDSLDFLWNMTQQVPSNSMDHT